MTSSSSKHGELSWCQRAQFWSHLTTTRSPSSPLNHWQTSDGPVHVLAWAGGPCGRCKISFLHDVVCYQLFSWLTMAPAALRSLTRSSCVVLGWFFTVLMIIETPRREMLHGAPNSPRDIDRYFVFLPFANNCTNCCHLRDGIVAHSSLCRSTIFSLDSSLILAMVESLESQESFIQVTNWD